MRFASLGSGSGGNGLVVEAGNTRVLLDCGFGLRDTERRLVRLQLEAKQLSGILLTHEHADHADGAFRLARKHALPVWLSHGTLAALQARMEKIPLALHPVDSQQRFAIKDLEIDPYPVPHDAREPVQFVFGDGAHRLGVLTDAGCATPHMTTMLSGCHGLVLECNHDSEMLRNGSYPAALKRRVASRLGHLSNDAAAELLKSLDNRKLQHIVAAHLSEQNNRPELAQQALGRALNCDSEWVMLADQENGFGWRQLS
ncbi:MAG: MBL fold metallo-hydrolase [Burkholderiales bacterium]